MAMPRIAATHAAAYLMLIAVQVAYAQEYPTKPIRIVTAEAGGGNDFAARLIVPGVSASLGQQVIVDNRGPGIIPSTTVSRAAPDGYTLLLHGSSIWLSAFLQDNVPYDALRDFSPITILTAAPNILMIHPSLPVKSVKDLITLAKNRPGELNYGASGVASSPSLAAELFKVMAGVTIVRINYRGGGPAANALIAGEVQMVVGAPGGAMPHIKSGRVRALGVTSAQASMLAPGIPTVAATGLPGYEYSAAYGVFAPAKTPGAIISRLNQDIARALTAADVKDKFLRGGVEPIGGPPEQLAAKMKHDMTYLGKLIKDLGIRGES